MASKTRFTATDVKAMVRDIRSTVLGQRVANVYNINDKTYLFKFAIPGKSEKIVLLLESGVRFHTTKYARDKNDMPSPFAMKLRKFIRTRRLEDVRQLGSDRVVDFKFGSGDSVCHIILELYASGNIVLTDGSYEIQALLRSHQFDDDIAVKMHEIYPIAFTTSIEMPSALPPKQLDDAGPETTGKADQSGLHTSLTAASPQSVLTMSKTQFLEWAIQREQQQTDQQRAQEELAATKAPASLSGAEHHGKGKKGVGGAKKSKVRKMTMRQLLLSKESGVAFYGPEIIDHCLLEANITPSSKVTDVLAAVPVGASDTSSDFVTSLLDELRAGQNQLALLDTPGQPGYVLYRTKNIDKWSMQAVDAESNGAQPPVVLEEYFDFIPKLFKQHADVACKEFPSFDEAVDEYFCKMEEQKLQSQAMSAEESARKRVNKVRSEMESQLKGFVDQQEKVLMQAAVVEAHSEDVDKVCMVINSALGAGLSWDDIAAMVSTETAAGNPIAALVSKLKLDKNMVVLRLSADEDVPSEDSSCDEESDDEAREKRRSSKHSALSSGVEIEIDLALSAHANANRLYREKKVARSKAEKTEQATERAVRAVEDQVAKQLNSQKIKRNLQAVRKVHWFEKFNWFVTSEGYLVLSGRDAQQNEALVKRYLRPGDAYVHADIHGASSCIVRCKTDKDTQAPIPISPFALQEAGTMTICRSGAWAVKVVTSAWWVHSSQVSKTAPSGEYLTTGSFMIYGRKNFLPPTSLEMGFGERKDRSVEFENDSEDTRSIMSERYNIDMEAVADPAVLAGMATGRINAAANGGSDISKPSDKSAAVSSKLSAQERRMLKKAARKALKDDKDGGEAQGCDSSTLPPVKECEDDGEGDIVEMEQQHRQQDTAGDIQRVSNDKSGEATIHKTKGKDTSSIAQLKPPKNQQARKQAHDSTQNSSDKTDAPDDGAGRIKRKKAPNKKKARRYGNQDDEDLELAMQALGHSNFGGKGQANMTGIQREEIEEAKRLEKLRKQEKAGVLLLETDWSDSLQQLDDQVRIELERLVRDGFVKEGEIDTFEISTLASFSPLQGVKILQLFSEDGKLDRIGNKSGFLAGIMRRFSKEQAAASAATASQESRNSVMDPSSTDGDGDHEDDATGEEGAGAISRRERKRREQMEIQAILEEEGVLDEMEGRQADELEKLTGNPTPEDILLYAVPVCGPYSSMQNMKFRVKLTPGTGKKGKTAKNAVEVFTTSKDCSTQEKDLIKGLTDPEMVAIMIGDVKLSVPGLIAAMRNKKNEKKKAKKK